MKCLHRIGKFNYNIFKNMQGTLAPVEIFPTSIEWKSVGVSNKPPDSRMRKLVLNCRNGDAIDFGVGYEIRCPYAFKLERNGIVTFELRAGSLLTLRVIHKLKTCDTHKQIHYPFSMASLMSSDSEFSEIPSDDENNQYFTDSYVLGMSLKRFIVPKKNNTESAEMFEILYPGLESQYAFVTGNSFHFCGNGFLSTTITGEIRHGFILKKDSFMYELDCHDTSKLLNTPVALKIFEHDDIYLMDDSPPSRTSQFHRDQTSLEEDPVREIEIMGAVMSRLEGPHSNIMHFLDILSDSRNVYVVMPLMQGNVLNLIRKCPNEELAKKVIHQIVPAITFLASLGIAPLDLSLENILYDIDPSSGECRFVLTDFGQAACHEPDGRGGYSLLPPRPLGSYPGKDFFCCPDVYMESIPITSSATAVGTTTTGAAAASSIAALTSTTAASTRPIRRAVPYSGFKITDWQFGIVSMMISTGMFPFPYSRGVLPGTRLNNSIVAWLSLIQQGRLCEAVLHSRRTDGTWVPMRCLQDLVSADLVDLLTNLLQYLPQDRLAVAEVPRHRWARTA